MSHDLVVRYILTAFSHWVGHYTISSDSLIGRALGWHLKGFGFKSRLTFFYLKQYFNVYLNIIIY